MENILFEKRDTKSSKSKNLLKEGKTPAVVYNSKTESESISIDSSTAKKLLKEATSTSIFNAQLDGKEMKVIVKEVDQNPLTEEIRHIAFFEIDETKDMVFTIPFNIIGVSPAVKNNLGVLVEVMPSINVKCKLKDLVPYFEIDVSSLDHPGQSISVNDLQIPEGITFVNDDVRNATIVTITELQQEDVAKTTETEEDAEKEESAEATEETTEQETE